MVKRSHEETRAERTADDVEPMVRARSMFRFAGHGISSLTQSSLFRSLKIALVPPLPKAGRGGIF
jgi:hypothetical protein